MQQLWLQVDLARFVEGKTTTWSLHHCSHASSNKITLPTHTVPSPVYPAAQEQLCFPGPTKEQTALLWQLWVLSRQWLIAEDRKRINETSNGRKPRLGNLAFPSWHRFNQMMIKRARLQSSRDSCSRWDKDTEKRWENTEKKQREDFKGQERNERREGTWKKKKTESKG